MPLEFGQVFQVPDILRIEVTLLADHLLAVEGQGGHFGHAFVSELDPPLPEADLFVASFFDSILSGPFAFGQEVDPFDHVAF